MPNFWALKSRSGYFSAVLAAVSLWRSLISSRSCRSCLPMGLTLMLQCFLFSRRTKRLHSCYQHCHFFLYKFVWSSSCVSCIEPFSMVTGGGFAAWSAVTTAAITQMRGLAAICGRSRLPPGSWEATDSSSCSTFRPAALKLRTAHPGWMHIKIQSLISSISCKSFCSVQRLHQPSLEEFCNCEIMLMNLGWFSEDNRAWPSL